MGWQSFSIPDVTLCQAWQEEGSDLGGSGVMGLESDCMDSHWVKKSRFVMCTWQWREEHDVMEHLALGAMWQHNMIWEAARHRSEKQTSGIEVKRQMGQEPWPDKDSHMWEPADVWSIIPSSGPLYTLLCVRAPWAPQSHIDKHYPNPFIYSFSLVKVGREGEGGTVSTLAMLALPLEWVGMFYIVLCLKVIFYFSACSTSRISWTDPEVLWLSL